MRQLLPTQQRRQLAFNVFIASTQRKLFEKLLLIHLPTAKFLSHWSMLISPKYMQHLGAQALSLGLAQPPLLLNLHWLIHLISLRFGKGCGAVPTLPLA
jgi:hypothetical protein